MSREVAACLKAVDVVLDKPVLDQLVKMTEAKKNHCSIVKIIDLVKSGCSAVEEDENTGTQYTINKSHIIYVGLPSGVGVLFQLKGIFFKYWIYVNSFQPLEETTDGIPDTSDNDSDGSWKQMLQYRSSQPVRSRAPRGNNEHDNDHETSVNSLYITGGAVNDASVKQKNIKKLRNAMLLSYHHNDGWFFGFNLNILFNHIF